MLKYFVLRLLGMGPLLLVVLAIVFTLGHLAPGDPIEMMYLESGQGAVGEEEMAALRAAYGLDRPLLEQFADYVKNIARGDLGRSITRNRPVLPMILAVFPITAQMGLMAAIGLLLIGIPLGIIAALKQNTPLDYFIVGGSLFLRSVPVYVLAPLLLIVFVLQLGVMKVPYGWKGPFSSNVILPVFLLMLFPLAVIIRQMRAGMLEVIANDYVRTARMKGLPEWRVVTGHILRNAITPVITSFGLIVTGLITGSVFLETIFGIPGFGYLFVTALTQRDYPLMIGCTLVGAFLVMLSSLLVDLVYPILDPRVSI